MDYRTHLTEDRRFKILVALNQDSDKWCNENLLRLLVESGGHTVSTDQVRTDLAWLAEQGLVEAQDVAGLMLARITGRGIDVARKRTSVPGVRPHTMDI